MNGKRHVVLTASVILSLVVIISPISADPPETKTEVRVCGLKVVGQGYGEEYTGLMPLSSQAGTEIALMVTCSAGGLISFDRDASTLAQFVDDRGTNLFSSADMFLQGFDSMQRISKDGKACLIDISGKNIPAKGATKIQASGNLILIRASKTQSYKQEKVALKKGTTVKAGDVPFTISEVKKPEWGEGEVQLTLQTNQDIPQIKSFKFYDAQGKEMKSTPAGSSRMQAFNKITVDKNFELYQKVDEVTIEITYWLDMQKLKVPFEVEVSVGL